MNDLLTEAKDDGMISGGSLQTLNALDIGAQIQNALGTPALDVESSEVTLLTMLIDDSASIAGCGNEQAVRDGHNLVIEALTDGSRLSDYQIDSILAHTCLLNGGDVYPYLPVRNAIRLDDTNYHGSGGTPLYDQTMIMLAKVVSKAQEFSNEGVAVRTVTLFVTDGHDEHSRRSTASDVNKLATDVLAQETNIIAAMGIDDNYTDFHAVFKSMGIRDDWILTPGNSQAEIRKAFQVFSQSAQQSSQNAQAFSSMGGFTP